MTTVYLDIIETIEVTRNAEDDGWDNGDSERDVTFLGASLTNPGYPYESFEYPNSHYYSLDSKWDDDESETIEPGDTVYVVICTYGTGSTFGSDGGQIAILLATKEQYKADMVAANPKAFATKGPHGSIGYMPWEGYFEWLQGIEVRSFVVGK